MARKKLPTHSTSKPEAGEQSPVSTAVTPEVTIVAESAAPLTPEPVVKARYRCDVNLYHDGVEYLPGSFYAEDQFILDTIEKDAANGYVPSRFFARL